ncbi:serine hydrolase [Actinopolymorpha sp. B11F2]|uniref:serine hydrolase domain-containing protein n=1 Tax=Actinopolymorpha sp. B11F2 TaxID=3160862 RepID=UPI0032E39F40
MSKSFTSIAVGFALADGLVGLIDRVVDLLPDHVPNDMHPQVAELTVHHLLSMTTGHTEDVLEDAWALEPLDLVRGFLRIPPTRPAGTVHAYNNPTTYVLARIVEHVTGRPLPEVLDERLFRPMGIGPGECFRVTATSSGCPVTATEPTARWGRSVSSSPKPMSSWR